MAIITVKTNYYYELLDGVKTDRGNRESRPPTGEQDSTKAEEYNNAADTSSIPSTLRQGDDTSYKTIDASQIKSFFPPLSVNKKKQAGKFSRFFRNISLGYGKKLIKNFPLAKMVFQNGELAGKRFYIYNINPLANPGGYIKIGRGPSRDDRFFISITSLTVSRTHAMIVYLNGGLIIVNYSSVNPAQLNGKSIPVNESAYIPDGATIKIGEYELKIEKIKSK